MDDLGQYFGRLWRRWLQSDRGSDRRPWPDANAYRRSDTDSFAVAVSDTHADANTNADADANTNADANAHADANTNADAHADADADADADANPDSDACSYDGRQPAQRDLGQ